MTTASLKKAIDAISAKIDENKDYLVQLDQQNGDGDLGISMSAGFHAVAEYLNGTQEQDLGRALNQCGNVFNEAAPSSLGTIAAFFFKGMARALRGQTDCTLQMVAAAMDAGVKNVMEKAGSKPGEKTILDSVVPGVKTLMAQVSSRTHGKRQRRRRVPAAKIQEPCVRSGGARRITERRASAFWTAEASSARWYLKQ